MILDLSQYYNIYLKEKFDGRFNTYYFDKDFVKNYGIISFSVCGTNNRDSLNVNTDFFQRDIKIYIDKPSIFFSIQLIGFGLDYLNGNHEIKIYYEDYAPYYIASSDNLFIFDVNYYGDVFLKCFSNSNINLKYKIFESYSLLDKDLYDLYNTKRGNKVYYDKILFNISSFKSQYIYNDINYVKFNNKEMLALKYFFNNCNYNQFIIYDIHNFTYGYTYLEQLLNILELIKDKNIVYCFGVNNNIYEIDRAKSYFKNFDVNYLIFDKNVSISFGKELDIYKLVSLV